MSEEALGTKLRGGHSPHMRTYIRSPDVNFIFSQVSRHPEISDFTAQAFANQHIPGGQISVNKLWANTK